jgi:Lrp/AsnC family leucine-responsive transcriptional regulator
MSFDSKPDQLGVQLDRVDWQILELLQENARLSYAEIGRQVSLSSPAVIERIRRLEDVGIIEGYYAHLNLEKAVRAFIHIGVPAEKYPQFKRTINKLDEVTECHHVTGGTAFIIQVGVTSLSHLEAIVAQLGQHGQTETFVILSSPFRRRVARLSKTL